tara:strand:+ start:2539 stop:4386 length:1848 start_codon:yes stop_codon:yes gene_type:complete
MNSQKIAEIHIGMNLDNHDTGIFVISEHDKEIFAISTDRITRYKHDNLFPFPAIEKYIQYSKLDASSVKKIFVSIPYKSSKSAIVSKNLYQYNLVLRKFLNALYIKDFFVKLSEFKSTNSFKLFTQILLSKDGIKLLLLRALLKINLKSLESIILSYLKNIFKNAEIQVKYFDHEYCHATSAYHMSPYNNALVFTMDGFGDDNVYSRVYIGKDHKLDEIGVSASNKPFFDLGNDEWSTIAMCSIGGIYSYFTRLIGFGESDEGKTEALAAYGNYDNYLYKNLKDFTTIIDGSIKFDMIKAEDCLNYHRMQDVLTDISKEDIAAALQRFSEDVILEYVKYYVEKYKIYNICLSGGVHANVIINLKIFEEISKNIYITPAMTDEGAAQGALIGNLVDNKLNIEWLKERVMPYYGPSYSKDIIIKQIKDFSNQISYTDLGDDWPKNVAKFVAEGKIGAIFHGRMEYGPRSLGNRSIVASPTDSSIRSRMNLSIKKRPEFQPFCPSMLEEEKDRLFDNAYSNKHMSMAFRLKKEFYDVLPSAIHVDKTARVQFVTEKDNKNYHLLLTEVKRITGYGVILNTSFNKHGRTVVEEPRDAIVDFLDTNMDYLVIEGLLVNRI